MSKENLDTNDKIQLIINKLKKHLKLIIIFCFIVILAFSLLTFIKIKEENKNILISEKYNQAKVFINNKKNNEGLVILEEVINTKHPFYSPLSLYLILDSNLTNDADKITELFDKVISNNNIDKENINLIKLKKALYLSNDQNEQALLELLNPIINSGSHWRVIAITFLKDYFLSKDNYLKAEEYNKLLSTNLEK
jgi:hypothetical protein|tara:strand:- start:2849 stop:3433 length:585 start_codon:yes stop_codon:yes gene_type:complete